MTDEPRETKDESISQEAGQPARVSEVRRSGRRRDRRGRRPRRPDRGVRRRDHDHHHGGATTTAGVTTTAAGATTTTAAAETTTTAAAGPVAGGILRHITPAGPQDVGFWPKMGPTDEGPIFPSVERINEYTLDRKLVPFLAKTFVEDPKALTMTCELKPGIMFHDGTELTADVAKWNYQVGIDGKKLQFADAIDVHRGHGQVHLRDPPDQVGQPADPLLRLGAHVLPGRLHEERRRREARETWAMDHCVGTGPFVMKEFVRDQSITWEKNPNYWQKGLPYLDGIDYKIIPDATTSSALMQAGQADIWQNADAQAQDEMKKKGFTDQSGWAGFLYHLMPNTMDPASPLNKQRGARSGGVRSRQGRAICKALGYGIDKPIYAVAPAGEWGAGLDQGQAHVRSGQGQAAPGRRRLPEWLPHRPPRDRADRRSGTRYAEAIKGYLDAAGFKTNLDIADPGRFYGSMFGTGWKDLGSHVQRHGPERPDLLQPLVVADPDDQPGELQASARVHAAVRGRQRARPTKRAR